ncbi:hypothetical protein HanPSC8_Chr08g0336901 [Helianthus annuus]|nr:hypothetical protein HanIR_Chr08g0376231 [Helianthus annuus]KAJ0554297.1 hypothetical protein HanHA89_Chr08g0306131 [Helianthus annuus]KAJ0902428.1 hypothetical protein HanPSC8_Chr08g0336901 [Helianthus annuus]
MCPLKLLFMKLKKLVIGKLDALEGLDARLKEIRGYLDLVIDGKLHNFGRDGIEAGTSLVSESIPRPIARVSVVVVGVTVALFLLKSFLSTAFFFLVYFHL